MGFLIRRKFLMLTLELQAANASKDQSSLVSMLIAFSTSL